MGLPFLSGIKLIQSALQLGEFAPQIYKWLEAKDPPLSPNDTKGLPSDHIADRILTIAKQVSLKDKPQDAKTALQQNPELKRLFQERILEFEQHMAESMNKERQDARSRDIALAHAGRMNFRADVMVISAALGLILCLASLSLYGESLPGEAVGIISTIAGIFGACLKDAYGFEFGSSRGSKEKDSTVALLLDRYESEPYT